MHLLNRLCQYEAYKDDKCNFSFKRILFAKFTQAHAAFGRGYAISSAGYFYNPVPWTPVGYTVSSYRFYPN